VTFSLADEAGEPHEGKREDAGSDEAYRDPFKALGTSIILRRTGHYLFILSGTIRMVPEQLLPDYDSND